MNACVLLSGGMDSVAALYWTLDRELPAQRDVRAVGFSYGQAHRDHELVSAGRAAREAGVPFEVIEIADGLHGGILRAVEPHDALHQGVNRAFVPGRNLVFLSLALARACHWWPLASFDLVLGSCSEDATGFPDCRVEFLACACGALSAAVDHHVGVLAPFVHSTKAEILSTARALGEAALSAVQRSWSCYHGGRVPCGKCTACSLRARAFSELGIEDLAQPPVMFGGDPGRLHG